MLGVDPSPILLRRARELSEGIENLSFQEGYGRQLPLGDASFDAVVLHRVLSYVPGPEDVLAEAFRVLRPGGRIAVFDGDYTTITLASSAADPWLLRRVCALVHDAGFAGGRLRSRGYVQVEDPDYMLTIVDRGADALAASGTIGRELADALKGEARRRVAAHTFFGHVAYASLIARRPG